MLDPEGNENEQAVARRRMKKLKEEHPSIHEEALKSIYEDAHPKPPPQGPSPHGPRPQGPSPHGPNSPYTPEPQHGWTAPPAPLWSRVLGHPAVNVLLNGTKQYAEFFREHLSDALPPNTWVPFQEVVDSLDGFTPAQYPFLLTQCYAMLREGKLKGKQTPEGLYIRREA